jgi:hypothetical protein
MVSNASDWQDFGQGVSFEKMMVPDAANIPPTPWQTEIRAPGIWAGAVPRIWRTLSCKAVYTGMHVRKTAAISVERQFAAGSGVALGDERLRLRRAAQAEVFEAVDRQMRKACFWQRTGGS